MKKLFSLLFVALLSMTAWGTTVTFTAGTDVGSNTQATSADSMTKDGVTISTTKGALAAAQYRFAASSTTTVTSTVGNITKVEFTSTASYGSQYGPDLFSGTGYTAQSGSKVGTWQGDAESFTLTASAQVRCSQIVVTIADPVIEELVDPVFTPGDGTEFSVNSLAVTVSCATPDANIYVYKVVDGDVDYAGGYEFFHESGEIYVTETTTYAAYATKGSDYTDFVYATYTKVNPTCATPVFTPGDGTTFEDELDVVISCETEGAEIWYTVNGEDFIDEAPVTVTLTDDATITAFASKTGYNDSQEATASYTKLLPYNATAIEFVALTDTVEGGATAGWHEITKDDVTMKFYGTVSNYTTSTGVEYHEYRIYKSQSIQFTSDAGNIHKIEFICAEGTENDKDAGGFGNVANYTVTEDGLYGVWEGQPTRNITFSTTQHQVRAAKIIVTVDDDTVVVPVITVDAPVISPAHNTTFVGSLEVTITCETENATIYYSTDEQATWTEYAGPFTITEAGKVYAYAQVDTVQSAIVSNNYFKVEVEVDNIGEANALDKGKKFLFNGEATVTYQWKNPKNQYVNTWIKDATGSGLIYGKTVPELAQGTVLKDGWDATFTIYNGIPEYTYPNNVAASEDVVEVLPTECAALDSTNVNEYVILKGQTITVQATDTTGKTFVTADNLVIYNQFGVELPTFEEGKTYDVVGVVTLYHNAPELYIISATEVETETWELGDVNHSGGVDIEDVTALINAVLGNPDADYYPEQANCNGEGGVDIEDVTALIARVLNGTW